MQMMVIYDADSEHTEQLARVIARALRVYGEVLLATVSESQPTDLAGVDLVAVGSLTRRLGMSTSMRSWFDSLPPGIMRGKGAVAFDTIERAKGAVPGSAADRIAGRLRRLGAGLVAPPESFLLSGRDGPLLEGELDRAAMWADAVV